MAKMKWTKILPLFSVVLVGVALYFLVGIFEKVELERSLKLLADIIWRISWRFSFQSPLWCTLFSLSTTI